MHAGQYEEALAAIARARKAAGPHLAFDANEAVCMAENGRISRRRTGCSHRSPRSRTSLSRFAESATRCAPAAPKRPPRSPSRSAPAPAANLVWPYLSIAWRMLGDPRWDWLEGDERLVGIYDLADELPPLDALADRLRALHIATGQPLEQSVRGGTQTDGPLVRADRAGDPGASRGGRRGGRAPYRPAAAARPAPPGPRPRRDRRIRFSGSWSVRLTGEGHHANHIHPGRLVQLGPLRRFARRGGARRAAGRLAYARRARRPSSASTCRRSDTIEPKPGRLVLFPSIMWHGTVPFEAGERLTVAFDVEPPRS